MIERSRVYLSRISVRLLGFLSRRYLGSSAAYGTVLHRIIAITLNSSVRFSSRWRLCAPSRVSEVSEVSTTLSLKQFNFKCLSDCRWPFLILSRMIVERVPFLCLSPLGDHGVISFFLFFLCPQVVSQAPQHLRPVKTQATVLAAFPASLPVSVLNSSVIKESAANVRVRACMCVCVCVCVCVLSLIHI